MRRKAILSSRLIFYGCYMGQNADGLIGGCFGYRGGGAGEQAEAVPCGVRVLFLRLRLDLREKKHAGEKKTKENRGTDAHYC